MSGDDNLIDCTDEVREMSAILTERTRLLRAARDALRSYQYGNAATDLAEEIADAIDAHLRAAAPDAK